MTALFGAVATPAQTDIKSALAFASLTQVGIIVAEIGCGLQYLALLHIIGHACLRTLQLLRAPTLLHDYHLLENAVGSRLQPAPSMWSRVLSDRSRRWAYGFALERGFLDALLHEYIVGPFVGLFRTCNRLEQRWTDWLSNGAFESQGPAEPPSLEEFL